MIVELLLVLGGLALLVLGGDLLVKGAVGLSLKLGMTPLVVGLTVVAFGTSAPELLVRELVDRLGERFQVIEREVETTRETIAFKLPRGLEAAA